MRLLIACRACRRQYEAGGKAPGDSFACVCGARVEVQAARPHDAAVVRCSSCGGTRAQREPACLWCASAFTLVEQDLNTVCPQCFTRISDRARHCHACGVPVLPQPIGAADPARPCPVCPAGPSLRARTLSAELAPLECERCGGLWLAPGPLRTLVARVSRGAAEAAALLGPLAAQGPQALASPGGRGPLYRACVLCGQRMNRTRFAGRTPVVVDYCRDHGVWFDHEELATALDALSQGRADPSVDRGDVLPGDAPRPRPRRRDPDQPAPWARSGGDGWDVGALGVEILGSILRLFH